MKKYNLLVALTSLCAVLFSQAPTLAYPSAIIFTPTGEVKNLGQASFLAYTATFYGTPNSWNGGVLGLLPSWPYGDTGYGFGGLEIAVDAIDQRGLNPELKTVVSPKLQLLLEREYTPSVSVGIYGLSPWIPSRGLNFTYVVGTKTLSFHDIPLGRITAGIGQGLEGSPDVMLGSFPFNKDANTGLLAGYESPMIGSFYFAFDHSGGISELGSTNAALNYQLSPNNFMGLGATYINDPTASNNVSPFVYFSSTFEPIKQILGGS
jgi:hypothetical protein